METGLVEGECYGISQKWEPKVPGSATRQKTLHLPATMSASDFHRIAERLIQSSFDSSDEYRDMQRRTVSIHYGASFCEPVMLLRSVLSQHDPPSAWEPLGLWLLVSNISHIGLWQRCHEWKRKPPS